MKINLNKTQITTILDLVKDRVGELKQPTHQDSTCLLVIKEFTDKLFIKLAEMQIQKKDTKKIEVSECLYYALCWLFDTLDMTVLEPYQFITIKALNIWNN